MMIDRREFLRKIGLGSVALASGPTLANALASAAQAQGRTRAFAAVALSRGATVDGVDHFVALHIWGRFDPAAREVDAEGNFVHFDNASAVPRTIINTGRLRPTKFLSYGKQSGTYGYIEASILELQVDVLPDLGPVRRIEGAALRLMCNVGPAGLSTGEPEGFVLTVPGAPFSPFRPVVPPAGQFPPGFTHISVPYFRP